MKYELTLKTLFFSAVLWLTACAPSADIESQKTSNGLTVYLGVLPAAMIQGEAREHAVEAHGDLPRGEHAYHVMVAIFDAESGERIEDAVVEAEVTSLGLSSARSSLDPMQIAGTITYGNYFTMGGNGRYRISVGVARPGAATPVTLEFTYEHSTR